MEINTKTHAETNIQSATISPLELYQQHVPKYLRQRLFHKISEGEKINAESTQMFASVLFADISGFTQLSSRLSAEELQSHINEYFTKLLGIVDENAGDVVKFCGDAVLIMWAVPLTASEETKAAAVLMSALCALQMLEECGEYRRVRHSIHTNLQSPGSPTRTRLSMSRALSPAPAVPSPGSVPSYDSPLKSPSCSPQRASLAGMLSPGLDVVELSLHCGISCGAVHGMVLGDNQRLEFILSGEVLSQMGAAEACAKAGEVCLHPTAYEKVSDKLRGEAVYPPKSAPDKQNFAVSAQPSHDHSSPRASAGGGDGDNVVRKFEEEHEPCAREEGLVTPRNSSHTDVSGTPPAPLPSDKPPGELVSFCEEDRELAFAISDLVLSPPHSVTCESPMSGRSAAQIHILPAAECVEEPKVPPPVPEPQPVAFLLTGRLNERLELSLKRRSRSSLRCTTSHSPHTPIASTSSVSLLGRSDRERTGSVLSFCAASDRVSPAGLFVSTKWSPGDGPLPCCVSHDDAATAADAEAQRQYALHELGLFPSNESAADLKPYVKNTLSVSTVQYLASLAKEITGISSKPLLVRTKNRVSAADVLPQANFSRKHDEVPSRTSVRFKQRELCEEFGRAGDEKTSFLGGQSGGNVSFRRKSLFGLFRSAKIRSESTDTAAGELKNDGEEENKRFCPLGEEKIVFSAGAGGEMSAKDSSSAVVGAGASSRFSSPLLASSRQGAHLSRKLQRQVSRNVSMLYANTRSSLGMFLPLSGSVLVQNTHTTSGYFSSTSAAAANDLENDYLRAVSSIDAAGVSQSPQRVHNFRRASGNAPNWDGFGPPPVSSSASGDENEHVVALGCPSSVSGEDMHPSLLSSPPHKVRKMPVARLKRKLKFSSDANIRAVRAYQDDSSFPANEVSTKKLEERSRKFISGSTRERNGVFGSQKVKSNRISGLNEAQAALLQRELARFTHETAARAIDSNTVSFLSEMRDVAVVFMQILDLEQDFAAGLHHKPQRVLCVILKLLRQFGGSLRQFVVDDKGCVAIACFGLSGSSNENNCLQAVEFAVTARTLLHTLGCRTASGITLGRVYCGLVGARGRCEYAVMGSSVNLAARLMAACAVALAPPAAPPYSSAVGVFSSSVPASLTNSSTALRGVFVDAAVHSLAHQHFHFEEHAHIAAKGYSEPVPVFVAVRKKPTTRSVPTHIESKQTCEGERRREEPLHVKGRHILRRDVDLTLSEKVKSTIRCPSHASSPPLSSSKLPLLERDGLVQEILDLLVSDHWISHTSRSNVRTFSGGSQKSRDSVLWGVQTRPKAVLERCVLIEGPAGVGRSSLLGQVLHHLATMGPELPHMPHTDLRVAPREVKIATVGCDPANQYVPYDLIRALLCKVIGVQGTQAVSEGLCSSTENAKTDKSDPEGENSPCFGANESNDINSSPQRPARRQPPLSETRRDLFAAGEVNEGLLSDNSTIWTKFVGNRVRTTSTSSSASSAALAPLEAVLETWCKQHVPSSLSLGAAFALCHPGAHLFEVLLFHDKQAPSGERNFSAAEENPQHASTVAALCEAPLVCFLPLLNDLLGMNLCFGSAEFAEFVPFEAVLEDFLSPVLRELLVDVLLQVLLMCVMGHQSLLMEAATPKVCAMAGRDLKSPTTPHHMCVLAVDDLQHADVESLNLICKILSGVVRLDTTQCASSGCFVATYFDASASLSAIVTSATLTGASAASFSVTRPLRQSIALHTETCASAGDLFSLSNIQHEAPSHHKVMKIIRKHAKVTTVPRLSKQAVRALMCHTLGPELWAWVLNNASLVLGTVTQSAKIKRFSPLPPSRSTNISPTDDRRAAALALLLSSRQSSGSLLISSPHTAQHTYTTHTTDSAPNTSIRPRRSSFHVPTAATAASAAPDRACFTTDGAAGIAMTEASAASVTTGHMRQNLIRRPRGQTEESKIVSLVYTLAQNGLSRGVIEICASLRHAIDNNAFSGLHTLPVVVKRNKLLLEVLDHLSGVEVVMLKAAAVIGGRFDVATLVAVLVGMGMLQCTQQSVLGGVLGRLVGVGLVRGVRESECGVRCDSCCDMHSALCAAHTEYNVVYEFAESTTQLAIYNLMMETQRAVAHGAIGAYLEALYDSTYNEHSTYSDKSTYGTYNPDCTQSTHTTTQSTRTTQSSTTINRPHHYTPTQLLHITHHYRHSDNTHKKVEYLLYCAQHYTSIHYYTSAITLYNELITLALGMCVDDVVSICRENEISAVAVLQMLTIPYTPSVDNESSNTGVHSGTGLAGGVNSSIGSTSVIDAAALRQQLFINQVAVLDVNMLKRKKKGSASSDGWWQRWLRGTSNTSDGVHAHIAASGGTYNIHTAHHATTSNTATRAKPQPASSCLVSSLAQDTAHALHYQHCAQHLAPLSLSELLVQRRVLLRVLAAHQAGNGSTIGDSNTNRNTKSNIATLNNAYTPLTAPPVLTLRSEVAACGVSMVRVAKWASYVAELHNRCEEEEDGVEYAALALHLTDLSAIPCVTANTTAPHGTAPGTTIAGKCTRDGKNSTHKLWATHRSSKTSSDKSTNSTNSTNSSNSTCTTSIPDASVDSVHNSGSSVDSGSGAVHKYDTPSEPHAHKLVTDTALVSEVCCGWWFSGTSHTKVAVAPLPRVPLLLLPTLQTTPVINIASAVDNVLLPLYPALPSAQYRKRSNASHCTLHVLLHPVHATSISTYVHNDVLVVANSCVNRADVGGVIVLLEALFHANSTVYTTSSTRAAYKSAAVLLSHAFNAVGDYVTAAMLLQASSCSTKSAANSIDCLL